MPRFDHAQTITHDIGADGSVSIRVVEGDVTIRGTDGTEARVEARFEIRAPDREAADRVAALEPLRIRRTEGLLEVEVRDIPDGLGSALRHLVGRDGLDIELEVSVPRRAAVRIQGVSGDIRATALEGRQEYRSVSGDVSLVDVQGELALQSVSGDVRIRASGPVRVDAGTTSGDVEIAAPELTGCRVQSVSGDVGIAGLFVPGQEHRVGSVSGDLTIAPRGGVTVEMSGVATSFRSDVPHRSESRGGKRVAVIGDGAATVVFRTMSGDLNVARTHDPGDAAHEPSRPAAPPASDDEPRAPDEPTGIGDPDEGDLEVLRALERGEIDVDEASRMLAGMANDG